MSALMERQAMKKWQIGLLIGMVLLLFIGAVYVFRIKWSPSKNLLGGAGASVELKKEQYVYMTPLQIQGGDVSLSISEMWIRKLQAAVDSEKVHWVSTDKQLPAGGMVLRPTVKISLEGNKYVYETTVEFLTWTGEQEKLLGTPLVHSVSAPSAYAREMVLEQLLNATTQSVAKELQAL